MIGHSAAKSGFIPGGDLSALIARLEAARATGIIMESEAVALCRALGLEAVELDAEGCEHHWVTACWNALKGSLDAALALAERVLDQRGPININVCLAGSAQAQIYPPDPCGHHVQAVAQTPALALSIAVLKAVQNANHPTAGYEAEGVVSPNLNPKAQGEVHD